MEDYFLKSIRQGLESWINNLLVHRSGAACREQHLIWLPKNEITTRSGGLAGEAHRAERSVLRKAARQERMIRREQSIIKSDFFKKFFYLWRKSWEIFKGWLKIN